MNKEEAEKAAHELIELSLQAREIRRKIKGIKDDLKEYLELENLKNQAWYVTNGQVEYRTETRYQLAEIPAKFEIDPSVANEELAQKAFKTKVTLSKKGHKMFKEQDPSIVSVMIPSEKGRFVITLPDFKNKDEK